jgi:hypothetical protein
MGLLVLSFFSIDIFTRTHAIDSQRKAQLQSTVSFVLDHMKKNFMGTNLRGGVIGDAASTSITFATISGDNALLAWVDQNGNGVRDAADKQIAYTYHAANYEMRYYANYTDSPGSYEILTNRRPGTTRSFIQPDFSLINSGDFTQSTQLRYDTQNNYLDLRITACWDVTAGLAPCGTVGNPSVTMHGRINMDSVSTH